MIVQEVLVKKSYPRSIESIRNFLGLKIINDSDHNEKFHRFVYRGENLNDSLNVMRLGAFSVHQFKL